MNMNELASQYATALFELLPNAEEKRKALDGLGDVQAALGACPSLAKTLCSPSFGFEEKEAVLREVFAPLSSTPHFLPFLCLVAKNRRFDLFDDIVEGYRGLLHAELGVKEGILYTAFSLEEEEVRSIETAFSARLGARVCLKTVLDPHLLGGVKVAIDGKVFDGSVKNRLQELRAHLTHGGNAQ